MAPCVYLWASESCPTSLAQICVIYLHHRDLKTYLQGWLAGMTQTLQETYAFLEQHPLSPTPTISSLGALLKGLSLSLNMCH